jgi:hypothetical protein
MIAVRSASCSAMHVAVPVAPVNEESSTPIRVRANDSCGTNSAIGDLSPFFFVIPLFASR